MDPFTLSALVQGGISLGTAIFQSSAELDAAKKAGKIGAVEAAAIEAAFAKLQQGYQDPERAPKLTAEEFRLVGQYKPEIASYVAQKAPQLVDDSGAGKKAQIDALNKFGAMAATGQDATSQAAQENAGFKADSDNRARQQQIMNAYAQRGLTNSGAAMGSQLMGMQDAAVAQRQQALQAAADAQTRRAQALSNYSNTAANVRGADFNTSNSNANIMNAFNDKMANSLTEYNRYVSAQNNTTQKANLDAAQSINDKNTQNRQDINNTNLTDTFNANNNIIAGRNRLNDAGFNATTAAAKAISAGKGNQNTGNLKADTSLIAGIAGAATQVGTSFNAKSIADRDAERADAKLAAEAERKKKLSAI